MGCARLIHQISAAISSPPTGITSATGKRRRFTQRVAGRRDSGGGAARPYFEVLMVTPGGPAARAQSARNSANCGALDQFVYEPVMVAISGCGTPTILNGSVQAVVIYDSIPFASAHNSPVLRESLRIILAPPLLRRTQDYGIHRSGPNTCGRAGHLPAQ
jgi:arginine decarboxylase